MSKFFLRDGRLAWPFFFVVVYVSVAIFLADYAWRTMQMPFESLILSLGAANVVALTLIALGYFMIRRKLKP